MLPGPLVSIYQQYKKDTDSVASWLASTAKACGYSADLRNGNANQPKGPGRLKGKARKEAKKQGNQTTKAATSKYTISIKDFVPLAEFIRASQTPLVAVPASFSKTINRVIAVRSSFGTEMSEHGVETSAESDANHSFFVGILETVRDVLKPRMPAYVEKAADSTSGVDDGVDDGGDFQNRFSGLKVYEPSQRFLDAPDIERPENAQGDKTVYEAEVQTSFEDVMIVFTMMMNDLNDIRSYITWIWSNYRDGMFDVAAAAVATNTGIDLARNLMEDILPAFEEHGGPCKLVEKFFSICASRKGYTVDEIRNWEKGSRERDLYDVADNTFHTASDILNGLVKGLSPNHLPLYKEGMLGVYDAQSDWKLKHGQDKLLEDQIILSEFFPEAVALVRLVPGYPTEDEFVRGVRELDTTRKLPFYLVFAAQVLLDVHHTIRGHASEAFDNLDKQAAMMDHTLNQHFEFHKGLRNDAWTSSHDRKLQEFQRSIRWLRQDPVHDAKERAARAQVRAAGSAPRHRVLKHSPILCGLVLYHFRARFYDAGIAVANAWASIQCSCHLYNALLQENLLDRHWVDMDVVQMLLGESSFFVGGDRPQDTEGYLRRYMLQMGMSASVLASRGTFGRVRSLTMDDIASRSGPRGIKDGAPVSCMFMDRYMRGSGQVDWKPEHIDNIIALSQYEEDQDGTLMMTQVGQSSTKKQPRHRRKAVEGAQLASGPLLRSLVLALNAEALEFAFPYLMMHRWCWKLLRNVRMACAPLLSQTYSPAWIEREDELPFVVGYIFMAAFNEGDPRPLLAAAEPLHKMIASRAGRFVISFVKRVYGFSVVAEGEESDGDEELFDALNQQFGSM